MKQNHRTRDDFPVYAKVVRKDCLYCGTPFWTNRAAAKFGTSVCRVYYWRENQSGKFSDSSASEVREKSKDRSRDIGSGQPQVKFEVKPYARRKIYKLLAGVHGTYDKKIIGPDYHEWIRVAEDREMTLKEVYQELKGRTSS